MYSIQGGMTRTGAYHTYSQNHRTTKAQQRRASIRDAARTRNPFRANKRPASSASPSFPFLRSTKRVVCCVKERGGEEKLLQFNSASPIQLPLFRAFTSPHTRRNVICSVQYAICDVRHICESGVKTLYRARGREPSPVEFHFVGTTQPTRG